MTVHFFPHNFIPRLTRALERMGGLYTIQDILVAIQEGRMQSFAENDSWAVTQIAVFPRAKVLEILLAVGNLDECRALHDRILDFARENDIGLVQAYGRRGWNPDAKSHGWKVRTTSYLYQREM